jgi:FKBP-type peptidyl-prolyl cis-trans isomerase FklB
MKLPVLVISIFLIVHPVCAEEDAVLKTEKDRWSYAVGMDLVKNMKRQPVELNFEVIIRAMQDALAGGKTLLNEQQYRETMTAFRQEMTQKQKAYVKELAGKNKKEGDSFLAENAKKEGVITLPSGLQYKEIKAGTGNTPVSSDTVSVHYRGTLIDGTEFDSSYSRGKPASFGVTRVIRGWTEALQLMKEGAKWQLFIPPDLAYGERGAGRNIGPNETLIFEVELLSIEANTAK